MQRRAGVAALCSASLAAVLLCSMPHAAAAAPPSRWAVTLRGLYARWHGGRAARGSAVATRRLRVGQAGVPAFPGQCNTTYDSQQSFYAETVYEQQNNDCVAQFTNCMVSGQPMCDSQCTANIDVLQDDCDDTYCEMSGENGQPANPAIPAFDFRVAMCYPDDCDQTTHDQVETWWRYRLCGPQFYQTPDCAQLQLTCAYDLSASTVWIIVGSVLGFFVFAGVVLFFWWYCSRKPVDEGEYEPDNGAYETFEGEHLLAGGSAGDAAHVHALSSSLHSAAPLTTHASPTPTSRLDYTSVRLPPSSATEDRLLSHGEEGL
ncbi:hypothetical protein EON67_04735 [archaeon]|nr:MAG: hypothetical protein EON67_04735 [archaeon]